MAYIETTGLLEIDRNYRAGRSYSIRRRAQTGLLERFLERVRGSLASGSAPRDRPFARLSDRMLEDIGLTRAEAIELDRRAAQAQ